MHAVNLALKYGKLIFAFDCNWSGNRYLTENGLSEPFQSLLDDERLFLTNFIQ